MNGSTFGDFVSFVSGGTPSKSKSDFYGGDLPWITGADIKSLSRVEPRSFLTPAGASKTGILNPGDLALVTRTSVGKVAIADRRIAFSQDITGVRLSDGLDARFVARFLEARAGRLVSQARGATIKGVTRKVVSTLPFSPPALDEQRRIAAILEQADAIRAMRIRTLALAESAIDSLFLNASARLGSGSRRVPLGELAAVVTKGTTPTSIGLDFAPEGIPFIRVQNLQRSGLKFSNDDLYISPSVHSELKRSQIRAGDILLSIAGTIGRAVRVPNDSAEMNCNQAVAIVRLHNLMYGNWVALWLYSRDARRQMGASSVTGTISNLSLSQVKRLSVPIPTDGQLEFFEKQLQFAVRIRSSIERVVDADDALFASLQSRAFKGEL